MSENSETKWTAGPWKVSDARLGNTGFPTKHAHYEIASPHSSFWLAHVLCFSDKNDGTEYGANAQLIAAAPDLYKGCEMALNAFENNWAINWDNLRRALEKARGTR